MDKEIHSLDKILVFPVGVSQHAGSDGPDRKILLSYPLLHEKCYLLIWILVNR